MAKFKEKNQEERENGGCGGAAVAGGSLCIQMQDRGARRQGQTPAKSTRATPRAIQGIQDKPRAPGLGSGDAKSTPTVRPLSNHKSPKRREEASPTRGLQKRFETVRKDLINKGCQIEKVALEVSCCPGKRAARAREQPGQEGKS